ncbi:phage late control D family protein [Methanosarcina sp. Mfa9]|uniref:phage late control D family protein n=1 Tax=Methanosarcina sp. Mfa9 TaxID=3439063 RepID=UPI003F87DD29
MTLEQLSAESFDFYAPRFEVEIQNQKLRAEMEKVILEVKVSEKVNEGASFELTIHDEFDLESHEYRWLDHELFNVGNDITIKMGYGDRLHTMIMGNVTSLEPSFFSGDTPTLRVGGQDLSYDYLKRSSPERVFVDKAYSEVARIIASDAGILSIVDDTRLRQTSRKRSDETYYAFLSRLGREVGYEFKMDGQTMYFVRPREEEEEILTLELGKDLISFVPAIRTSGLLTEVEVRGYNPRDPRTPIVGRAQAGSERSQNAGRSAGSQIAQRRHGSVRRVITDVIVNSTEHANSIARAELERASGTLVEGRVECIGIPQIRTGVNIRIEKVGARFSDKYYVKETTHTINTSGYRTSFFVRRNSV